MAVVWTFEVPSTDGRVKIHAAENLYISHKLDICVTAIFV
jgi:hypothetical protein